MKWGDIIFAVATSSSRSALHLTRISGPRALETLLPFLLSRLAKPLEFRHFQKTMPGTAVTRYIHLHDAAGEIIDDCIITSFLSPHSYTGEDLLEISTHGNPLILSRLHGLLRHLGMRDAEPGEFTQRAVLNGKLDLAQAEAIHQLVVADSQGGIALARGVNQGTLSKLTKELRLVLIESLAYLEAHIDFGAEDVGDFEPWELVPRLEELHARLKALQGTFESGKRIREGVKVVLCGRPNAGKSSLYNSLLRSNRAIVTNVPGTTRDVLEERLFIGSRDFVLLDTAGLRESDDLVERIGIERSKESMVAADVVCLLIDASLWQKGLNPSEVSKLILDEWTSAFSNVDLNSKCVVLVFSKKDLLSAREEEFQKSLRLAQAEFPFEAWKSVHVAVEECDELREALISAHEFKTGLKACKDAPMLISQRQRDKVLAASEDVREALVLLRQKDYPEKVASILNSAKISLEEIVGEISLDSVLDSVFSSFCIGK